MRNALILVLAVLFTVSINAQDRFDRIALLNPNDSLEVGGYGNVVAGVDFDNDGFSEIYFVNNDWKDVVGGDLVPRMYKYEADENGRWNMVWWTRLNLDFQNTWPSLAAADLDKDGKGEIVWGPVNNFGGGLQPNPARIVVFETPGDGSDNMGIDNGDGTSRPNSSWTITDTDNDNVRPFRWIITDIDGDQNDEIVTGLRGGNQRGQIYSVDNIPDTGDSTETWTLEWEGLGTATQYDVQVIDSVAYYINSSGNITTVHWSASQAAYVASEPDTNTTNASWKSASVADIDGNGTDEIVFAAWFSGSKSILLLDPDDADPTQYTITEIANFDSYTSIRELNGGDVGDIDGDGNVDFIFGTRDHDSPQGPQNNIVRVEYQGGAIDDPASYTIDVVDRNVIAPQGTQADAIAVANIDNDPEDEIIYCGETRPFGSGGPPVLPVVVLDGVPNNQPIIAAVADVPNDQGRQVWVVWRASADDALPPPVGATDGTIPVAISAPEGVEFPQIQVDGLTLKPMQNNGIETNGIAPGGTPITHYVVWRIDQPGLPVQVAQVVPIQAGMYAAVVPTLGDGDEWRGTYVVSAHTPEVTLLWKSFPKRGVSEDNLIPTAPTGAAAGLVDGSVIVTWDESPDPDFNYFSIRRGAESGFDPSLASEVGTTTSTEFLDSDVQDGTTWYYRVVAFDFNENEGEFSQEVSAVVTGIGDNTNTLPQEFALSQNFPNPFNPETTVAFDLPENSDVTLKIYNTRGQLVKTLVNENKSAGTYQVVWNSTDNFGNRVASGLYIYSIKAGNFSKTMKMTLIK